ncbi:MAG: hypothetical protein M3Q16_01635, partial [Pseudomonadota bacterium]|nr:hypothetical protein [Pseudomonadota bacterium]
MEKISVKFFWDANREELTAPNADLVKNQMSGDAKKQDFLVPLFKVLLCRLMFAATLLGSVQAIAGNQKEEALADSVRIALSNAVADGRPPKVKIDEINERIRFLYWRGEMSERLKRKMPDVQVRLEFLETVWYESKRAG